MFSKKLFQVPDMVELLSRAKFVVGLDDSHFARLFSLAQVLPQPVLRVPPIVWQSDRDGSRLALKPRLLSP